MTSSIDLFHVGVKLLLINTNNKVLILKTDTYADLPGGRMHQSEQPEETITRELDEETGIKNIKTMRHIGMTISKKRIPISHQTTVGLIFSLYTAQCNEYENVIISDEHTSFAWVSADEAIALLSPSYGLDFIRGVITQAMYFQAD
jgi:8-oxo-dGTP pyrophosphatase MutT (NUDIX family)